MLVIKIELWPRGDESRKKVIGHARIINDGSGNLTRGNYICQFWGKTKRMWREVDVKHFPRQSYGPWILLKRALEKVK